MLDIYQAIRDDSNEGLLRKLVEEGKLTTDTRNKECLDALMLAVDCEFSTDTIGFLLTKGFKLDSIDD